MELGRHVVIFLSEMGHEALQAAGVLESSGSPAFYALESDETGVWVSVRKKDGEHHLLIRWDCILALDVPLGGTPFEESAV